jgi:tetratricopeptide (TPR) repeat protein
MGGTMLIRCCAVVLFFCSIAASGQTLQEANALLGEQKYTEAEKAFRTLTAADANNGGAWLGLGQTLEAEKRTDEAVAAYQKTLDLKIAPKLVMASMARTYAAAGQQEKSYDWLDKLTASGTPAGLRALVGSAPAFAAMREQPRFKELQEKMKACNTAEYHQFDFWVGSWEVQNPQGQVLGHNNVTSEDDGCVLQEHWASQRLEKGTSFNFFDNRDNKWHQIYFDNSGNMGAYPPMAGGLKDGRMVFLTDATQSPLYRWTFYPLNETKTKVRQWAESSNDGGKTWTTIWDSVYVKQ